ncbi:hypothetical protein AM609_04570 [Actinomyces sp. oral taxon 414]|nr:hypothetical protein AM609_04570 [Actinomyces sp. oral taxon 414]
MSGRGGIAGGEVDGALIDVHGQDSCARGGVGQGQSDRPPPAAQVQQEARPGRVGDVVEEAGAAPRGLTSIFHRGVVGVG